ncbi:RhtB family transporter [Dictyobacter alpinus]|uniref:RhtB family transporter n=1 Tax=Dictyobacter alpinus TaxID=2014873 RepID=A0A402BK60_9CHLR|nr:LysE family translocator [Dictyobacter alpinus]GCE31747.1 RhtB family transporter [Dictyobacter alpinus]
MPTLTNIFLLFIATILICIVPGPDMLYILARSTSQGRSAGVVSCVGIASGGVIQTTAVALGLSGLFLVVPFAYDVIKYAGAVYLVYLGIRTILSRKELLAASTGQKKGFAPVFFQGMATTLLNPKIAFFYLAFLPQFVNQSQGHVPVQLLILGLIFNITSLAIDTSIAVLASFLGLWLKGHAGAQKLISWLTGGVFVGLGIRLAFSQRQ